ncbi:asparagine synthase (glutamine-hydrolyzing) [Paraburkholderia caffeinilytica]|uniref:asparagine synthase (glutamine-hydrolyzing) n=1 Tax=Paraburkholderia caffeinilytica TaxID=1761016 RepID=UPI0038BDFE65
MCGLIFLQQNSERPVSRERFETALNAQSWRGPDAQQIIVENEGQFLLGHNRLSIIDPVARSNQPMRSACGRYLMVFNGEIYNHLDLRKSLKVNFKTTSDTETIIEGFARHGIDFLSRLDGMFALVIYDSEHKNWLAARDPFGIKPLFIYRSDDMVALGSEAAVVASLVNARPCDRSIEEWKLIRRPVPGASFFIDVDEVKPGTIVQASGVVTQYWKRTPSVETFSDSQFQELLSASVRTHELSDVSNVALLSGGLDSAVITALSSVQRTYTVGLNENNEAEGAMETARHLEREVVVRKVSSDQLIESWRKLTRLRGEPLSVPNEGLIYLACKSMSDDEKVVLTGEGADELLFGYDGIYRWSTMGKWEGVRDFLDRYGYSDTTAVSDRLTQYIETIRAGKTLTEFVEDFFYDLHLPGLLRRMDFASMAASKEARVPFVNKSLVNYMYRRPASLKITATQSKIPLRTVAESFGLRGALDRKKIGFSASLGRADRKKEYAFFQKLMLEELKW